MTRLKTTRPAATDPAEAWPVRLPARLAALACMVAALASPLPAADAAPARAAFDISPEAARWKPILVADPARHVPGPPPAPGSAQAKAELAELLAWQARRTVPDQQAIAYWSRAAASVPWSREVRDLVLREGSHPPRAARAMAHVSAAMYDAVVITWRAKAKYRRPAPAAPGLRPAVHEAGLPSYPSEHAAVAYAAAEVMAHLYPGEAALLRRKASLAAETRIAAGVNVRSDLEAGRAIGVAAAAAAIARARHDGADRVAKLPLVTRPGQWTHPTPMEPLAGSWKPWLLASGSQFRLPKPKAPGSPIHRAALAEVLAVSKKLTPAQVKLAKYWNFDVPAVQWNDLVMPDIERRMDTPTAARTLAVLDMLLADAFIACWDTKYVLRELRPDMIAKDFRGIVMTPPHPSYPSGHATASMAAAVYLARVFPDRAAYYLREAETASASRLWAGIHFRRDNDDGLRFGRRIATYGMQQAQRRGLL